MYTSSRKRYPNSLLITARIVSVGALFVLVYIAPWWVVFIVGTIATFFFRWFIELVFLAYIFDFLYHTSGGFVGGLGWAPFFALLVILCVEWLRPRLIVLQ